eukprot:scaffold122499_cov33-Tisochrysis_lutea.AAC.1
MALGADSLARMARSMSRGTYRLVLTAVTHADAVLTRLHARMRVSVLIVIVAEEVAPLSRFIPHTSSRIAYSLTQ